MAESRSQTDPAGTLNANIISNAPFGNDILIHGEEGAWGHKRLRTTVGTNNDWIVWPLSDLELRADV